MVHFPTASKGTVFTCPDEGMAGCGGRTDGSTDCQYGRFPLEMQNTHVIHSLFLPSISFHFVGNMDEEINKTFKNLKKNILKIQEFIGENKNHSLNKVDSDAANKY